MKSVRIYMISTVIAVLGGTIALAQPNPPPDLDAQLQEILEQHQVPGAALALMHRDSTVWIG